jgi:cytidyltransferase-like protein
MTVVYIDMCADLFHWGHVNLLKNAKSMGDKLIVGIHSDETIKKYKREPIMKMKERIAVIESCKYVDVVIPDAPLTITEEYIKTHNIDLVVHAHHEHEDEKYKFMYGTANDMGKFKRLDYSEGVSTTEIINRIQNNNDKYNSIN